MSPPVSYKVARPFRLWLHAGILADGTIGFSTENVGAGEYLYGIDGTFFIEMTEGYVAVSLDPKRRDYAVPDAGDERLVRAGRLTDADPEFADPDRAAAAAALAVVRAKRLPPDAPVIRENARSPEYAALLHGVQAFANAARERGVEVAIRAKDLDDQGPLRFDLSFGGSNAVVRFEMPDVIRVELPRGSHDIEGFRAEGHRSEANRIYRWRETDQDHGGYHGVARLLEGHLDSIAPPTSSPTPRP